jgi:hypothetical protein
MKCSYGSDYPDWMTQFDGNATSLNVSCAFAVIFIDSVCFFYSKRISIHKRTSMLRKQGSMFQFFGERCWDVTWIALKRRASILLFFVLREATFIVSYNFSAISLG